MAKRVREVRFGVACPGCGGVLVEDPGPLDGAVGTAVRRLTLSCPGCSVRCVVTVTLRALSDRRSGT